jgi:hypothetical protein
MLGPTQLNTIYSFLEWNYTLLILSQNYLTFNQSVAFGAYVGLYSTNMLVNSTSTISSKGGGCKSNEGMGCGFLDWTMGLRMQCGGTGASHGGSGSPSISPS